MTDKELLAQIRKDLIKHFGAKSKDEARNEDYLVTYTEKHQWILSPRSRVSGARKVVTQTQT